MLVHQSLNFLRFLVGDKADRKLSNHLTMTTPLKQGIQLSERTWARLHWYDRFGALPSNASSTPNRMNRGHVTLLYQLICQL